MSKKKHIYGWTPAIPDHRDFKYALHCKKELHSPQLERADVVALCPPIVDQANENSCAGNAGARAYDFLQLQALRTKVANPEEFDLTQFEASSRNFVYYNARLAEKGIFSKIRDSGVASLRDICQSFVNYGSCPESLWAYTDSNVDTKPSQCAYDFAAGHKVAKYIALEYQTPPQIFSCIISGNPIICGLTLCESFESDETAATGVVCLPQPGESVIGGHAVTLVGFDRQKIFPQWGSSVIGGYLFENSWGTSWGLQGKFWLPMDYIHKLNLGDDFYTLR